jgi:hypothetical protein
MCVFLCPVTSWSDERDSAYRIAPSDRSGYRTILLNPNRISDLLVADNNTLAIPRSIFKYFDNNLDRREKWGTIKADMAVSTIIAAADTPFFSSMVTINIHRNNNPHAATVATTIPWACLAYADDYNQDDEHCWIVYYNAAFKRREVLADLTIEQLEDIAETGDTTTTTTTPAGQR